MHLIVYQEQLDDENGYRVVVANELTELPPPLWLIKTLNALPGSKYNFKRNVVLLNFYEFEAGNDIYERKLDVQIPITVKD